MRKYKYRLSKQVEKFLEKQEDSFLENFQKKLLILCENPFENNLDIKFLAGEKNNFRLRIGKYRFLYEIFDDELILYFYKSGSRGDIYK